MARRGLAAHANRAWEFEDILEVRRRTTCRAQFEALVRWVGEGEDGARLYDNSWVNVNNENFPAPGEWGAAAIKARAIAAERGDASSGSAAEAPQVAPTRVQPRRQRRQVQRLGFGRCYRVVEERNDDGRTSDEDDEEWNEGGTTACRRNTPGRGGPAIGGGLHERGEVDPGAGVPQQAARAQKRRAEPESPGRSALPRTQRTTETRSHAEPHGDAEMGEEPEGDAEAALGPMQDGGGSWVGTLLSVLADDNGSLEDLVKCAVCASVELTEGFLPRVLKAVAWTLVYGGEDALRVISTIERWVCECEGEEELAAASKLDEWGGWRDRALAGEVQTCPGRAARDLEDQWRAIRNHVEGIVHGHLGSGAEDRGGGGGGVADVAWDDWDMGEGAC
jgi:hypothetical protein